MQITNEQLLALISAIVPLIVSLAAYLYKVLVGKLPAQKQMLLQQIAIQAVHMAEQVGGSGNGAAKRAMAENAINESLKSLGMNVAPSLVNAAIESVVFSLNQQAPKLVIHPVDTSSNAG
ncbi:MAG: phage holin [Ktedonobacteraceae bacterium]|nr:phage holin [Ktedonobacteraceae bacterium]